MNIEEERKAFESALPGFKSAVHDAVASIRASKRVENDSNMFTAWIAAKAHAEEMGKPAVETEAIEVAICELSGGWGFHVCTLQDRIWRGIDTNVFARRGVAKQWAKDNGYRVVSE